MAAVALPILTVDRTGTVTWGAGTAANAGTPFTFANSGNQIVRVTTTAGADTAITFALANPTLDGITVPGKATPALGATVDLLIGPFPVGLYGSVVSFSGPALSTTKLWVIQFVPNL